MDIYTSSQTPIELMLSDEKDSSVHASGGHLNVQHKPGGGHLPVSICLQHWFNQWHQCEMS